MPARYLIFPSRDLLILQFHDHVTHEDYRRVIEASYADPDYRNGMRQLVDLSSMTSLAVDPVEIMKIEAGMIHYLFEMDTEQIVIAIAPHELSQRGIEMVRRSWEGLDLPIHFRLCIDVEQAAFLLGLPESFLASALTMLGATDRSSKV